jgi:hypothetical protein
MRAITIALSALLIAAGLPGSAGAQAAVTQDYSAHSVPAATEMPSVVIRLADGAKGGDKYMSGKAGGRYGIGGSECRSCKKNKKKKT